MASSAEDMGTPEDTFVALASDLAVDARAVHLPYGDFDAVDEANSDTVQGWIGPAVSRKGSCYGRLPGTDWDIHDYLGLADIASRCCMTRCSLVLLDLLVGDSLLDPAEKRFVSC